jgi:hypothetical protein
MAAHAAMKSLLGSRRLRSLARFAEQRKDTAGSKVHSAFVRLGPRGVMYW